MVMVQVSKLIYHSFSKLPRSGNLQEMTVFQGRSQGAQEIRPAPPLPPIEMLFPFF